MDASIFGLGLTADEEDVDEKARRAVKAFRALQPTLNAYARMLTRRPSVRVEMDQRDNGSTDGNKIYFRPPIALGDNTPHERRLCDKRDEKKSLLCPACAIRESVLVTIYHEIAHICFDSFQKTSEADKAELISRAVREANGKYAEAIADRIKNAPYYAKDSYIGIASLISPFLPIIVNALEDARVNRELFKIRPGTKIMFDSDSWRIFTNGVEQKDSFGNVVVKKWNTYPLNMQVIVGLFCKASGYDYSEWFVPKVVNALDDEVLTRLVKRLDSVLAVAEVYHLSFPILVRLRELGFCKSEDDPLPLEPDGHDESGDSSEPATDESTGKDSSSPDPEGREKENPAAPDDAREGEDLGEDVESGDSSSVGPGDERGGGPGRDDLDNDDSDPGSGGIQNDGREPSESVDSVCEDQEDNVGENERDEESISERSSGIGSGDANSRPGEDSISMPDSDDESDIGDEDAEAHSEQGVSNDSRADKHNDGGDSEDDESFDSGADPGEGGVTLLENKDNDDLPMGSAEDCKVALLKWGDHEEKPRLIEEESRKEKQAIEKAIIQGIYFETPSNVVLEVRYHHWQKPITDKDGVLISRAWSRESALNRYGRGSEVTIGLDGDFNIPESILGPALMRMRVAFTDNQRGATKANLKSGKMNARVLGKRAFHDDQRLFRQKTLPGKKNYFVLIGMDISGSTVGLNLYIEKKAVLAQAELLSRMGIPFEIYAHSGNLVALSDGRSGGLALDLYVVKELNESWNSKIHHRVTELAPDAANLDGHTLEQYRKRLDSVNATDKIILYYSDGKMPAENHDEELEILQREIRNCKTKNYTLLGVGIRTDSPARHGLDTVQVDSDTDIVRVVSHLEKRLVAR